jgi:hypothetical protein
MIFVSRFSAIGTIQQVAIFMEDRVIYVELDAPALNDYLYSCNPRHGPWVVDMVAKVLFLEDDDGSTTENESFLSRYSMPWRLEYVDWEDDDLVRCMLRARSAGGALQASARMWLMCMQRAYPGITSDVVRQHVVKHLFDFSKSDYDCSVLTGLLFAFLNGLHNKSAFRATRLAIAAC